MVGPDGVSIDPLPVWDTETFFPSGTSRQFRAARELLGADLARLRVLYDSHDVGAGTGGQPAAQDLSGFEAVLTRTNAFLDSVRTVSGYLSALISTDSDDDEAAAAYS